MIGSVLIASCAGSRRAFFSGVTCCCLLGCGSRDSKWNQPFVAGEAVGLTGSVAVLDTERNELMMLTSPSAEALTVQRLKIGKNVVSVVPSNDREHLFVLTRGDERRLHASDEPPELFVVSGGTSPSIEQSYTLSDPAQKLALDPDGRWAVVYDAGGVVVNGNELILVDLQNPNRAPLSKTIRSTGGEPQHFTFTPPLTLPNQDQHRLLVVETQQDLALIDLENPDNSEITVPVPKTSTGALAQPNQVVFHDGGANEPASYLAVSFVNDSSVLTLKLENPKANASATGAQLSLTPNLLDAGALPSTIEFVETDSGLRLAALVPTQSAAVLFDPATSKSELVQFDQPYSGLARITGLVSDAPANADVALLYSSSAASIAFWRLGAASGTPYASFDSYAVDTRVASVLDIPGTDFGFMKLLVGTNQSEFFLLDLQNRQSYPMQALNGYGLSIAPDGLRAWAFLKGGLAFAQLDFASKHPASFAVERPISGVFDIARADGQRSALVLHTSNAGVTDLGVTVFDAEHPDSTNTRFVSGLMLEGL